MENTYAPIIGIYVTGKTYPDIRMQYGDFENWFTDGIVEHGIVTKTFDAQQGEFAAPDEVNGIIITGSSTSVCTEPEPWIGCLVSNLRLLLDTGLPMLGVCFGHQALASAAGARVTPHPVSRELGTTKLYLTDDGLHSPLFRDIPENFLAQETHEDVVSDISGNPEITVLAGNQHNQYQALQYRKDTFSVQFHPEITLPVMEQYLRIYGGKGLKEGWLTKEEYTRLEDNLAEIETGTILLRNFAIIVHESYKKG